MAHYKQLLIDCKLKNTNLPEPQDFIIQGYILPYSFYGFDRVKISNDGKYKVALELGNNLKIYNLEILK